MRTSVLIAAALVLAGSALAACRPAAAPDRKADRKTIEDGERAWGGMLISGDARGAETLLDDTFRGIDSGGRPYTKADMIHIIRDRPHLTSDQVGPITVRFYGDTAVAQGTEHEVGPPPARAAADSVWTDVWVKRDGHWRIVAAQDQHPAP